MMASMEKKSGYSQIQLTVRIFIQHLNPFIVSFKDENYIFIHV